MVIEDVMLIIYGIEYTSQGPGRLRWPWLLYSMSANRQQRI